MRKKINAVNNAIKKINRLTALILSDCWQSSMQYNMTQFPDFLFRQVVQKHQLCKVGK